MKKLKEENAQLSKEVDLLKKKIQYHSCQTFASTPSNYLVVKLEFYIYHVPYILIFLYEEIYYKNGIMIKTFKKNIII